MRLYNCLPFECIEEIITRLPPRQRFTIAVHFRLVFIRNKCLSLVAWNIDFASSKGLVDLLDAWKNSGEAFLYSVMAMDHASAHGHIRVLDWWRRSGFVCRYTRYAMDYASRFDRIDVLNWWCDFAAVLGRKPSYTEDAMNWASIMGHIRVLKWWKRKSKEIISYSSPSGKTIKTALECRYTESAMDGASAEGRVAVLQWWIESGLQLRYSKNAMDGASLSGHVNVLKWWLAVHKRIGLALKYSKRALDMDLVPTEKGTFPVLEWWLASGLDLKCPKSIVEWSRRVGHVDLVETWLKRGYTSRYYLQLGVEMVLQKKDVDGATQSDANWDSDPSLDWSDYTADYLDSLDSDDDRSESNNTSSGDGSGDGGDDNNDDDNDNDDNDNSEWESMDGGEGGDGESNESSESSHNNDSDREESEENKNNNNESAATDLVNDAPWNQPGAVELYRKLWNFHGSAEPFQLASIMTGLSMYIRHRL